MNAMNTFGASRRGGAQAQALRARWAALPPREQRALAWAGVVVALALLWWLALGPALATLRSAPARHAALDAELARMRALEAQAVAMKGQPSAPVADPGPLLESSVREQLGDASRLLLAGDRATVTLSGVGGERLAQWLAQARINAHVLPGEARLNRNASGTWDGTLVLSLPRR